ncbi:MAG: monoheme cytochrome SoxX [Thiobacillus sp.]|nr:monoheme cytochrome SoxX [Thiobacillus sp.]
MNPASLFDHRLILLATPRQIGVLDWRPGQMHWLGEFSANTGGLAGFNQVVLKYKHLPFLLVIDTVDEDYRSDILPHVQGRARDELLARKLKQVFRNARFMGAWRQMRETTGRRDDRYLLAALTDAEWLTPWLSILHREKVPLAGITPLALACQHLLHKLRLHEPHTLLACRLNNSLRLSYYHNGLLRFSRLIGGDTPTQLPSNAADEITKTQLYLTGQRILPREARLHVLLLDPSGQLDSAQAPLNADPAFSTRVIDIATLSRALHIPDSFLAAAPEIAPLAAIAGESLQLNLAPPELLRHHTEYRWRRGLHAVAGFIALLGTGITAAYWLHAQDLSDQTGQLTLQQQQLDARYQTIARNFPTQAATPEQLAQTVALAHQLNMPEPDAYALMAAISQAVQTAPLIRLDNLSWTHAPDPAGSAAITLDAALTPFDGNYRAAMQHIERFINALQAIPTLHNVSLQSSPVNADSSQTLSGKTYDPNLADAPAARFSLSLEYREVRP